MDVTSLLAGITIAVGLAYAIGAVVLLRHLVAAAVTGEMLVALGDAGAAAERRRVRWWMVGATLLLAAGVSLAVLSRTAPLFYGLAGLFQLAWLASAARRGSVQGAARADLHAVALYLAFGVLVAWADLAGQWHAWVEPAALEVAAVAGIAAGGAAVLLRHAAWRAPALTFAPRAPPPALRLVPAHGVSPLRDAATDAPVDPAVMGLDARLVARIAAWDSVFQAGAFADLATEQAWFEEGLMIAGALQLVCEGSLRVELSSLDALLLAAGTPAPHCGVAEIRDAFQRLEILALAGDQAAAEDAAALADEARRLAAIVAQAAPRYGPEVEAGLRAAQPEVRAWIAQA